LNLHNDSATDQGVTVGGAISNIGMVTNTGIGTGYTLISGAMGPNVTQVVENSSTSALVLTGANTYAGPTTITAGTLILGDGTTNGTIANSSNIADDGTMVVNHNDSITISQAITGAGSFVSTGGTGGTGTTTLTNTNNYSGTTTVTGGTLQFATEGSLYNNTPASWTDTNIIVQSGATAAFNVGGPNEFTLTPGGDIDTIKAIGTNTGGFTNGSNLGLDTTNAGGSIAYASVIADTNTGLNSVGLTKLGAGTLELTAPTGSTYTGGTKIKAGNLQLSNTSGSGTGTGPVTVSGTSAATTGGGASPDDPIIRSGPTVAVLSGTGVAGGITTVGSATTFGVIRPGPNGGLGNGTLTIGTGPTHTLTIADGSQMQLSLSSSTQVDAAFDVSGQNALTYLDSNGGTSGTPYTTIWGNSGGSGYDTLKVTGDITIGTGGATLATIAVLDNGLSLSAQNTIFKLIDWSNVGTVMGLGALAGGTGAFNVATDLILPTQGGSIMWDTSAFTKYGIAVASVVPEPSRVLLLFFGLAALFLRRRRNR
jgi:autotransporter-associated beta strand protein